MKVKTFVETDLDINPDRLKFYPKFGEKIEYEVSFTNRTNSPININEIKSTHQYVQVIGNIEQLAPKETQKIKVVLRENAPPGRFNGKVNIKTDLKSAKNAYIRFWGSIEEKKEGNNDSK